MRLLILRPVAVDLFHGDTRLKNLMSAITVQKDNSTAHRRARQMDILTTCNTVEEMLKKDSSTSLQTKDKQAATHPLLRVTLQYRRRQALRPVFLVGQSRHLEHLHEDAAGSGSGVDVQVEVVYDPDPY